MKDKKDIETDHETEEKKDKLILSLISIKRQLDKENKNETSEIKLGRRLEERSYPKLSEKILRHLISRYEIDNNKLPTKKELIKMMINFLGNIQKNESYYNLINNTYDISNVKLGRNIGNGLHGKVYSFKLNSSQTKKDSKYLAYKHEKGEGVPYPIDIHITSAILLALYDFQPKYYNQYFMEIGKYENKSKNRTFQTILSMNRDIFENNIQFYILYNFTNISDQFQNSMIRVINDELIKIDLRRLNSEKLTRNIEKYLNYFDEYREIFLKNKQKILKELNKLLILNEEFLIDLIKFRTERGGFDISPKELAIQIDCISSSYKVAKLSKNDTFRYFIMDCKKVYINLHLETNPAFSWMLYLFFKNKILNELEYEEYTSKFNEKSKRFEIIANKIRKGEPLTSINKI